LWQLNIRGKSSNLVDSIIELDFHQSQWLIINNEGGSLQIAGFTIKQKHVASILTVKISNMWIQLSESKALQQKSCGLKHP